MSTFHCPYGSALFNFRQKQILYLLNFCIRESNVGAGAGTMEPCTSFRLQEHIQLLVLTHNLVIVCVNDVFSKWILGKNQTDKCICRPVNESVSCSLHLQIPLLLFKHIIQKIARLFPEYYKNKSYLDLWNSGSVKVQYKSLIMNKQMLPPILVSLLTLNSILHLRERMRAYMFGFSLSCKRLSDTPKKWFKNNLFQERLNLKELYNSIRVNILNTQVVSNHPVRTCST